MIAAQAEQALVTPVPTCRLLLHRPNPRHNAGFPGAPGRWWFKEALRQRPFSPWGWRTYIQCVLKRNPFIVPSAPVQKQQLPSGPRWLHEVTFDAFRAQLHKRGDEATIFSRKGHDYTRRFPGMRDSLISLPARSAIIDAEIVVCDSDGQPGSQALMQGATTDLCAWCFDLLELNGSPYRRRELMERKLLLRRLLITVCAKQGLAGIVSKLKLQPYRSGKNYGWVKVKSATWREANRDRGELFAKH